MFRDALTIAGQRTPDLLGGGAEPSLSEAQAMLEELASVFLRDSQDGARAAGGADGARQLPNMQARYRSLVEQLPAVVFLVYLDRGIGEAYVSPYIEAALGFSQAEWLEDPVRWYRHIHPEDNLRWSEEAAEMLLTGNPLRSVYRVIARDGHVVWFHCEAKMVRSDDGHPWFIQGVAFDITEVKQAEEALQQERNFVSAILNTVGTLIMVLDLDGRVVQFNRACEQTTGRPFEEVRGTDAWELFSAAEDRERFKNAFERLRTGNASTNVEWHWLTDGGPRLISWSGTVLPDANGHVRHIIATGIDITESKRLEKAILEISAREEHRIAQDLHDGLGQHLTGIAFMSKVLEQKLADKSDAEAADASKIVRLVNEAIHKTRELSRGLLPVVSDARGLMSALEQYSLEVQDLFGLSCSFECDRPVLIFDETVATHLYRIAQEAVNNAIKHGHSKNIMIKLCADGDGLALSIRDDGRGLPANVKNSAGMGLHIMNYRAKMIGGMLQVQPCSPDGHAGHAGTVVTCKLQSLIREGNPR
jgi:PAS domain S-box-containing protein